MGVGMGIRRDFLATSAHAAFTHSADSKSALDEMLARREKAVTYERVRRAVGTIIADNARCENPICEQVISEASETSHRARGRGVERG